MGDSADCRNCAPSPAFRPGEIGRCGSEPADGMLEGNCSGVALRSGSRWSPPVHRGGRSRHDTVSKTNDRFAIPGGCIGLRGSPVASGVAFGGSASADQSGSPGWFKSRWWSRPTPTSASASGATAETPAAAGPEVNTARRTTPETDIWPEPRTTSRLSRLFPLLGHRDSGKNVIPGDVYGRRPGPDPGYRGRPSGRPHGQARRRSGAAPIASALPLWLQNHPRDGSADDVELPTSCPVPFPSPPRSSPTSVPRPRKRRPRGRSVRAERRRHSRRRGQSSRAKLMPRREAHLVPAAAGSADLTAGRRRRWLDAQDGAQKPSGRDLDPPPPPIEPSQTPAPPASQAPPASGQLRLRRKPAATARPGPPAGSHAPRRRRTAPWPTPPPAPAAVPDTRAAGPRPRSRTGRAAEDSGAHSDRRAWPQPGSELRRPPLPCRHPLQPQRPSTRKPDLQHRPAPASRSRMPGPVPRRRIRTPPPRVKARPPRPRKPSRRRPGKRSSPVTTVVACCVGSLAPREGQGTDGARIAPASRADVPDELPVVHFRVTRPRASPRPNPGSPVAPGRASLAPAPPPLWLRTEEVVLLLDSQGNGLGVLPQVRRRRATVHLPVPRIAAEDRSRRAAGPAPVRPDRASAEGSPTRGHLPRPARPRHRARAAPARHRTSGPVASGSAEPGDCRGGRAGRRARRGRPPRRTGGALARGARPPRDAAR